MQILLLLCLSLACLPVRWPDPEVLSHPWQSAVATLIVVLIQVASSYGISRRARQLDATLGHSASVRYYGRKRTYHALLLLLGYLLALYGLGWGWAVQTAVASIRPDQPLLFGTEFLILAPLPIALIGCWICFYDAERALQGQPHLFGGRWGYVTFQIRQHLTLVSVPVVVLIMIQGLFRLFPETFADDLAQSAVLFPLSLAALLMMPWGLRLILRLSPLPAGPLRDRLEAAAVRLGCRCSDILVWDTKQSVVNAMVVGVLPQLRYILLSDRLLTDLAPEEVEAVFGHEAGHVRHRHMIYYLVFLAGSLTIISHGGAWIESQIPILWPGTRPWLATHESWLALPAVAVVGGYTFIVFGFVSRRCERQADVFGCKAVSCAAPGCTGHDETTTLAGGRDLCPEGVRIFCRALDKVAVLNGISRSRPGWLHAWQHGSIAQRIAFLESLPTDPKLEPRFQRRLFWVKASLLVALFCAAGLLWPLLTDSP